MIEKTVVTNLENLEELHVGERKPYIIFIGGPALGKVYVLEDGEHVVGRGKDATIVVDDESISRRHIQFSVDGQHVELEDLDSTNGTFVNGRRIARSAIADGDRIQISTDTIIKFSFQDKLENIFHKELYRMAVTDPLTNIYNKRFFTDRLAEEFSHAKRNGEPLSLLMLDVDHFKLLNDTHGHLAGDSVLQGIGERILHICRSGDIFARYGGEEFTLLLRKAKLPQAIILAERVRSGIADRPFEFDGKPLRVTVSIGVASFSPDFVDARALIQEADRALYEAKNAGRNAVASSAGVMRGA